LTVTLFLYACIGKGQIFQYLGWVNPRRPTYWFYAVAGGGLCALLVVELMRITGNPLGVAPPSELLYGVTIGPIIEEVIYLGAGVFRDLRHCMLNGKPEKAPHSPADCSHFTAIRVLTHQGDGSAVATDLWNGFRLRPRALALELNGHLSGNARGVQRNCWLRNALALDQRRCERHWAASNSTT
jgi:hypothetical protein